MERVAHFTANDDIAAAVSAIRRRWSCPATTAVILGTGLGDLADELGETKAISYSEVPGFPRSTALAHKGRLVCGELGGAPVVMMQGRCHFYEGYSLDDLTLPVRVLAALGINTLIVTNAAGGLNPRFSIGDVMLVDDHINLMWRAGGAGLSERSRHVRFYDLDLGDAAQSAARQHNFPLQRGVYVAVTGPSYETRAEYRAFRRLGGDCVGMSTVPEVLAAASCGLAVLALSTVTNVANPDAPKVVSAEEVVEVAAIARPRIEAIVRRVISWSP
jgi:purine-nucleoside phosphorylase